MSIFSVRTHANCSAECARENQGFSHPSLYMLQFQILSRNPLLLLLLLLLPLILLCLLATLQQKTLEMNGEAGNSMMTPPPSSGMAGMKKHMGGGGMMHMTFFWGKRVQILFTGWPGDQGVGMYLLSLLCVLFVAALVELLSGVSRRVARPNASRITGFALTVLHAVRIGMSYLVMLAVMSFNVGVLIAAIVGHALGFLFTGSGLFKWSRPTVDPAGGDEIPSIKD